MTIFDSTNDTCTACGYPLEAHDYVQHTLGTCPTFTPSPQADAMAEPVGYGCFDKGVLFATFFARASAEEEARMHQGVEIHPVYRRPRPQDHAREIDLQQEAANLVGVLNYMEETNARQFDPSRVVFLISLVRDRLLAATKGSAE